MPAQRILSHFERRQLYWNSLDMFDRRRYHWFATLSFPYIRMTFDRAMIMIIAFLRDLQKTEGIQIACYCALCLKNGIVHAHLLMLGRSNRTGKTLLDAESGIWESKWKYQANIEPIYDHETAIRYMAAQFFRNQFCTIVPYNKNLLKQTAYEWEHRGPLVGGAEDQTPYERLLEEGP
jgi:hypothetical protein